MKVRVVVHYLLFMSVIVGAFAAMAQNDYGLSIIGTSCFLMALFLSIDLFYNIKQRKIDKLIELSGIVALFILFGLRALYIHFIFVEIILLVSCLMLIAVYTVHMLKKSVKVSGGNLIIKRMVFLYYAGINGFLLSIILTIFLPALGEPVGIIATVCLGVFIFGVFRYKSVLIKGERVNTSNHLVKNSGHSLILGTGFLLISIYTGLNMFTILPTLHTSKLPSNYIELVNQAETGTENPIDGKYKYQNYEEAYNRFLERHSDD